MEFTDWFNKLTDDTNLWLVQELSQADAEVIERINNGDDIGV